MLQTQNAKFIIALLKNRWYKKGVDIDNINTIYDSFGIYKQTDAEIKNSTLISMYGIQDFRQDCLDQDSEIEHTIMKR